MQGDKLDQVKAAGAAALEAFSPEDEIGLWTFSDFVDRLVPIGPLASNHDKLAVHIKELKAGGATALYKATSAAVADVQSGWDARYINAVLLLSDGQDSSFGSDSSLVRSLGAQPG